MPSSISWLDASSVEQQRMREILGLFTDKESREELGLGQVRDALADGLFPGTSTLHTRARYFLFIPWLYQQASHNSRELSEARKLELALIEGMKKVSGRQEGVIGYEAGDSLKTVPSSMYWSALGAYGILTDAKLSREQAVALEAAHMNEGLDEAGASRLRAWRAGIPAAPENFPHEVTAGFNLTPEEAAWLRERIVEANPTSLFAHLLTQPPGPNTEKPWQNPVAHSASPETRTLLEHARLFSETMHGAQLLYNLLIAESYEAHDMDGLDAPQARYEQEMQAWAEQRGDGAEARNWDLDEFFAILARVRGSRIPLQAERFVRGWAQLVAQSRPDELIQSRDARELVRTRERQNKGKMARIGNPKRLAAWGGGSGSGQYRFRWGNVQRLLDDIHAGLASGEARGFVGQETEGEVAHV